MRPRVLLAAAVAATVVVLASGCGAGGQPDALEACKSFTNATSGLVSPGARDARLADAERWAGKAADKSAKWRPLLDALRAYHGVVDTTAGATDAGRRLVTARATINARCEAAAKGY